MGVMLSGETANGDYPRESVQTMVNIIREAERSIDYNRLYLETRQAVLEKGVVSGMEALASSAVETAFTAQADLLAIVSETGRMALLVAKYRPKARILVLTSNERTARQLSVSRGVWARLISSVLMNDPAGLWKYIIKLATATDWVKPGDKVVVVDRMSDLDVEEFDKQSHIDRHRN